MSSRYVIIVAGGSGSRMGTNRPKQFLSLKGLPILMHTIRVFHGVKFLEDIIVVLPKNEQDTWTQLCSKHSFTIPHILVDGGETRFNSVKNGLKAISGKGLVAIHDGVRPLVSSELIEKCFAEADTKGNAVPATRPAESVRRGNLSQSNHLNRDECWLVQTPQVFRLAEIKEYYYTEWQPAFTDDASVAEYASASINMVEGERENIKITTPLDMAFANAILSIRE